MFSIFKKNRSFRKSVRSVNAPIYYLNEEPVYHTPSDEDLFENIYSDGLEVDEMTIMKAREGNEKDLLRIGYMYFSGHTRNDYLKALDWFMKSAEKNSAEAEFRIAELYYQGQGVEIDLEKSFEWCSKAAEKGYVDALNKLGWRYLEGWGVPVDKKRAIYWFTKAADQGDWIAQEQLDSLREDNVSFSDEINLNFTGDDDYSLDITQEEIGLPMEVHADQSAELKEIMSKYEKLQHDLDKKTEEMRDMAKAIEVLQSSMSDSPVDEFQTTTKNNIDDLNKSTSLSFTEKSDSSEISLENSKIHTRYDAIIKNEEATYCESPLEEKIDWDSEDGQDPNYDSPEEEEKDEEKEEEEDEGQDPNYDSPEEEEEEGEEEEKEEKEEEEEEGQDPNYDSPSEDDDTIPNARFSSIQTKFQTQLNLNRSKTL